ncbi:MAG: hypothetical protein D6762_08990, partial [Candidatus Neomarinimicrobiota bacterium]
MNKRFNFLLLVGCVAIGSFAGAQVQCDPEYSISNFTVVNGAMSGSNDLNRLQLNAIGSDAGTTPAYQGDHSLASGFWGYYNTEPFAPRVTASDGDFQDRIEVSWDIIDDNLGAPVSGSLAKVYRNGSLLTTVPLSQTTYQDFNVFPGEFYNYEVVVENDLGESYRAGDVGFLNPNGLIMGTVKTMNQVPVPDVEVRLSPNLGLALDFNGTTDFVTFDSLSVIPVDTTYTIEGWFRAYPDFTEQTLFAATDIGHLSDRSYIRIALNADGQLQYTHRSVAGSATFDELTSLPAVNDLTWHHFAAVNDGVVMQLYLDGDPVGDPLPTTPLRADVNVSFGKNNPQSDTQFYHGRLDDFRFWTVARSQEEVRLNDQHTLNGEEAGLYAYWKFDEVLGEKIFDLTAHDIDGYVCGLERTELHAPVYVSGITDATGSYLIKGIYYGSGTTFTVMPSKETPIGTALEFDGMDDYILFPYQRLDLTAGYTLECWLKTTAATDQTLVAAVDPADNSDQLVVDISVDGTLRVTQGATVVNSSIAVNDAFWHHVAVTQDGTTVTLYIDGNVAASAGATPVTTLSEIVIGRRAPAVSSAYFHGKLDEVRVWDSARTEAQIEGTMSQVLHGDEVGLVDYWKFNEGFGDNIADQTATGMNGTLFNMGDSSWVEDIPLDEYFTHYFDVESRQATLNPSNTSVDRVDFTDLATVSVTGYVRYENSSCFAEGVEILVDGESAFPPIYTDATGRFLAEFEPGRSGAILTPVLEGHTFVPTFIELPTLNAPLSGLVITDKKKNSFSGKVVGGKCQVPITPSQGQIEVHIASVSGCIDTMVVPDVNTGEFLVENLPPLIYNVTVDHPDPAIDQFFTGDTVSLVDGDASMDFVYRAPPEVVISGFHTDSCGNRIVGELEVYTFDIDVFESYSNAGVIQTCPVDTGLLTVTDYIGDASDSTYRFVDGHATWTHKAGYPNILGGGDHPFRKNIQVVAEVTETGEQVTATEWAIVLGNRPRNSVFTTTTPEIPVMILRDPPGDASYAFYSTENSNSYSLSFETSTEFTLGVSSTIHMGSDWILSAGAWGVPDIELETTMDLTNSMSVTTSQSNYFEQNWTITTTESYQTSDDNAVVGEGGDMFIGGAMNLLYGVTDVLRINDACQPEVVQDLIVSPQGFATNYVYSQAHIVGTLIPSLYAIGDTASARMWEQIIQRNNDLKDAASFSQNISFDGATGSYEYAETTENSQSMSFDFEIGMDMGVALEVGAEVNGVGASGEVNTNLSVRLGAGFSSEFTHSNTYSYVLSDDDPGDYFSVNVFTDGVYGSPVFELVSGASSCPWEPNTAPREDVTMSLDQSTAINVPPDEPAVFTLILGNTSQTDEDGTFDIQILQDTNPDGANISINGVNFEDTYPIFLLAGQQTQVTMTVERGPTSYSYHDIGLRLQSGCEYELWGARGDATAPIPLSDSVFFSVEFSQPCSEVAIAVPESNWLITGADASDSLWVTLNGYDRTDTNFTHLELQYRPNSSAPAVAAAGSGTTQPVALERRHENGSDRPPSVPRVNDWFTAVSIPRDSLMEDFVLVPWNIDPAIIPDGAYEVRAVAFCNAGLYPGTSQILPGIIDRTPPAVVGLPSPVDGVLGPDDLISVTLDEDIDCEAINPGAGDVQLVNTVTGNPVDFTYTCGGNEIFLEPNVQNQYIENQILRVTVNHVRDVYGNERLTPIEWEFFVNRNPIEWEGGDISDVIIYDDESFSQERYLVNNGGSPRNFTIQNVPSWLNVTPVSGTIAPGGTQTISISVPDQIAAGQYQVTLLASGTMGDEPLAVDIRILCHEPDWTVSPSEYQYSMNMISYLFVDDQQSQDVFDQVGAFVGEEPRGVATVQYVPDLEAYELFLTIYSNQSQGEDLTFKVWDASTCVNYGFVLEEYSFEANAVLGTLSDPVTLTATNQLVQSRALPAGWTWFSLNLESNDMSTNEVLTSLAPASGDLIKSQTAFDQFVPSAGWVGGLDSLRNTDMYQIKLTAADSLDLLG